MNYFDKNALKLSHAHMRAHIKPGSTVVDATAGKGRDTLLLSELVGECGQVFAFDIQPEAIAATKVLLDIHRKTNVTLLLESHDKLANYVSSADAVIFNFGFLPGGDHNIFSHGDTSIRAIEAALSVLKDEGFVCLCLYYGGDTGFEERDSILNFLQNLDQKVYTVMLQSFYNRKNCPPLFAVIEKNR